MKKGIGFLLSLVFVFMLAGCQQNTSGDTVSVPALDTDPPTESTDIPTPPDTPPADSVTHLPSKGLVDSITFVNYGVEFLPVSFVDEGKQQLFGYEGEWLQWKDEINNRVKDEPQADALNKIDTEDMYLFSGSKPEYGWLLDRIFTQVASTGDWDFFPVKVRYEKYTLDDQPNREEWIDYFGKKLTDISPNTPLVFTEAWFFDWNMDGNETVMVNASNVIWHYGEGRENAVPNPPPSGNTASYDMTALFVPGNEPMPFDYGDYIDIFITKEQLNEEDNIGIDASYLPPDEDWYDNSYSVIQSDAQEKFIECPVYTIGEIGYINDTMVLLCDIDGDGQSELLTMRVSIYAPIIVYKLIDGKAQEAFRINTGA